MSKQFLHSLLCLLFSLICINSYGQKNNTKPDTTQKDSSINVHIELSDFISEDEEDQANADSVLELFNDVDNLIKFTHPWRLLSGDDTIYANANYDDSKWLLLSNDSLIKGVDKKQGIFWYRMHFSVDSNLIHVPLAFFIKQFGSATDVYLDGKFLKSYGKVGKDRQSEIAEFSINPQPFAFVFSDKKKHVLAIRYSNFHRTTLVSKGLSMGKSFKISVKHLNAEIADVADPSKYFPFIFFAAIFLTLGVVHLIMFIFNSEKKSNFSYSIYCIVIFLITYYCYYIITATDYDSITTFSKMIMYLSALVVVPLVSIMHRIFYGKRLRIFWFITALIGVSLLLFFMENYQAAAMMVVVVFMISTVEILRVIIKAIRRKKDGAWIFAFVIFLAPLMGIISSNLPDEFVLSGIRIPNNTGVIVLSSFILGLPFSMTLYLARDFARMGKQLKKQLKEITDLSEKTIHQEKEKKQILENQKSELEIKVVERTQEVWQQKEVIEIKNKEITDSLNYAKRIQTAILPDVKLIYKTLDQSFILYLPKDIVSGDFYSFAHKDNKVLIAAADCTGHGVAGAFMSMIGSALLNQIINEKNITTPSIILDHLNEGIVDALKQKENETSDGMDISICAFDLNKTKLEFAGANRPLWIVRNKELLFFKPNKFPIGGLQVVHDEKFSQHTVELQKDDSVYLFSDGYADQFGGERGKKLMTKKFREILLSIQHQSMPDQQFHLHKYFNDWKGVNEQVDDVLIIGIRI